MKRIRTFTMLLGLVIMFMTAVPARASILVDHPPMFNGPSADTDFITTIGNPYWQLLADDFTLQISASIAHVRFWGLYGNHFVGGSSSILPPVGDETMRIRVYNDQGDNGLPGNILYERSFLNPSRSATGEIADFGTGAREYVYDVDLPIPFEASADARYWLEIVQVGIPSSVFRWEFSSAPNDTEAFINPDVLGWTYRPGVNLAFQLSEVPEPEVLTLLLLATSSRHFRRRIKGGEIMKQR